MQQRQKLWGTGLVLLVLAGGIGLRQFLSEPSTSVVQENNGLTFTLKGHPKGARPTLTLTGRYDYTDLMKEPHYQGSSTTVRVTSTGVSPKYPAHEVRYTWDVNGLQYSGTYMTVHPDYPGAWKKVETELFTLYYTVERHRDDAERWERIYRRLSDRFHTAPRRITVFVLPDRDSLLRLRNYAISSLPISTAYWSEEAEMIYVLGDVAASTMTFTMAHELTHALLSPSREPKWWEEGIATYMEIAESLNELSAYRSRVAALRELAQTGKISLSDAQSYGQKAPADPYTVGLSFVLFVQNRVGSDGLDRLVAAAHQKGLTEALTEVLGMSPGQAEAAWLEFIRSDQFRIEPYLFN